MSSARCERSLASLQHFKQNELLLRPYSFHSPDPSTSLKQKHTSCIRHADANASSLTAAQWGGGGGGGGETERERTHDDANKPFMQTLTVLYALQHTYVQGEKITNQDAFLLTHSLFTQFFSILNRMFAFKKKKILNFSPNHKKLWKFLQRTHPWQI